MKELRKHRERRNKERRRNLNEVEFRRLIATDKARDKDQRVYKERRGTKRRKRQIAP